MNNPNLIIDLPLKRRGSPLRPKKKFYKYTTELNIDFERNSFLVRRALQDVPRDKPGIYKLDRKTRNRKYIKIFPLLYILPIRTEFEIKVFSK